MIPFLGEGDRSKNRNGAQIENPKATQGNHQSNQFRQGQRRQETQDQIVLSHNRLCHNKIHSTPWDQGKPPSTRDKLHIRPIKNAKLEIEQKNHLTESLDRRNHLTETRGQHQHQHPTEKTNYQMSHLPEN